jgi:hypothetical protein
MSLHADPKEGEFYVFSDEGQDLYGGGELPIGQDDLLPPLPNNLRNTRSIHEFVSVFYDPSSAGPGIAKGPPGRRVEVLSYADPDELARLVEIVLINLTEQEKVPLEDIVVLTPSGKEKSGLWARQSLGRFQLSDRPEAGKVLWASVHSFKGLERQVVVLAEVSDKHDEDVARYLRAGGSRARNHLVVIAAAAVAATIRHKAESAVSA